MEKNNNFIRNMTKVLEAGLISSKSLRKEAESTLKFKLEEFLSKLNLVSREEFEVQKKIVEKLQYEIQKLKKSKKGKKINKKLNR